MTRLSATVSGALAFQVLIALCISTDCLGVYVSLFLAFFLG